MKAFIEYWADGKKEKYTAEIPAVLNDDERYDVKEILHDAYSTITDLPVKVWLEDECAECSQPRGEHLPGCPNANGPNTDGRSYETCAYCLIELPTFRFVNEQGYDVDLCEKCEEAARRDGQILTKRNTKH